MVPKDFDEGDLVWAKMKGYPYWPARVERPPAEPKTPTKKPHHYVHFFGSDNYAWISDENIVPHSEEMLESCNKKKSSYLKKAIDAFIDEINKGGRSSVKDENETSKKSFPSGKGDKETPKKSQISDNDKKSPHSSKNMGKKSVKTSKPKIKEPGEKIQKKVPQKRPLTVETHDQSYSPSRRATQSTVDYTPLMLNCPPNLGYHRVAVIKPLDEFPQPSGINKRQYFDLKAGPSLDLRTTSEVLKEKKVVATKAKIGFIGLGMMGQRIVKNLINSGHKVTVWNRTTDKCNDFVEIGAEVALTPGDVVAACDITFSCVSSPEVAKSLVFGNCGILSGLENCQPGSKGYVEMTTIDPLTSQEIAEAITHKGGRYLEAPITGSRELAEEGSLLILAAGDRELFANVQSCFYAVSKHAYYLSCDVGHGCKMNLVLSSFIGTTYAALAEAVSLIERCSLSAGTFLEILQLGPVSCPHLIEKGQSMLSHNFATNASLKYQQKDLHLALQLGDICDQPMSVTSTANELYKHAKLLRYSEHDVSAVYLGAKY